MNTLESHRSKYIFAGIMASLAGISMVMFPKIVLGSAQRGIDLWASSVLPALLPFFICSDFMISIGIPSIVGKYFEKSFQKAFGVPGSSAFVFIISITSGYPMGARAIGRLKKKNEITDRDGIKMLSFCSTSGPLFMLGVVGAGMLNSVGAGAVIALSHYISAMANGFLFRILIGDEKNEKQELQKNSFVRAEDESIAEILTASILSSLKALGIICCYIVIFTYITDLIEMSGLLSYFGDPSGKGFIKGLIEITVGLSEMSLSNYIDLRLKTAIAAFLVSFGGFSVMAQSLSVLGNLKIDILTYLFIKLTHAFMAGSLALFLAPYILEKATLQVALMYDLFRNESPGFFVQLLFSSKMLIMVMLIFLLVAALETLLFRRKDTDSE